jgi:hypothetical protein
VLPLEKTLAWYLGVPENYPPFTEISR